MSALRRGLPLLVAVIALAVPSTAVAGKVEVVVTLDAPPLARAVAESRTLTAAAKRERLDLRSPASTSYLREVAAAQRTLASRIRQTIPQAQVRWHYGVVANGMAVVVPTSALGRLAEIAGPEHVYPSLTYRPQLDRTPALIGATTLWGPGLTTAGEGVKIGILDLGIESTHPFFNPAGFTMPPGFPKGQTAYTTAKIIVARAFPPPGATRPGASVPFEPQFSEHGTHTAGIAAGDNGVIATTFPGRPVVSGIAPRAYLGNYKVYTRPCCGALNGNSPEVAAGIEAAVRDGMDVISLSIGAVEIPPRRDIVVKAIDAAAAAGVVPTVSVGNDFGEVGLGTISSPATAPRAIAAAASTTGRGNPPDLLAGFSSAGPTPISLRLKPDVTAPGSRILSSVPTSQGSWTDLSGTSMAAPHVAGAAALLRQRHPRWTVAQIKSALVQTGDPVFTDRTHSTEVPTTREGGGRIDLLRADRPLLFAAPTSLSFGLVHRGRAVARAVRLTDAGGGTGAWQVAAVRQGGRGVTIVVPGTVSVAGTLRVTARVARGAAEGEVTGFVVLSRSGERRRIPFWLRVAAPRLATERRTLLRRPGTYRGNTAGKPGRVSTYRYPDDPRRLGVPVNLAGPEQVFRIRLRRPAANFGVAVISQAPRVRVQPHVMYAGDENRLTGYAGLPLDINIYRQQFFNPVPVAGAIFPTAGFYDIVFDSVSRARAGRFTFRFWIGDTTAPAVRVVSARGSVLTLAVTDRGAGVDPRSLSAVVDGNMRAVTYRRDSGRALVDIGGLGRGTHQLVFTASDYQETKNNENMSRVTPNTLTLRTNFSL
jgi:subtilisin family serine protease